MTSFKETLERHKEVEKHRPYFGHMWDDFHKIMHEDRAYLIQALLHIGTVQDKIRYACDDKVEKKYVQELLALFDADSGDYVG